MTDDFMWFVKFCMPRQEIPRCIGVNPDFPIDHRLDCVPRLGSARRRSNCQVDVRAMKMGNTSKVTMPIANDPPDRFLALLHLELTGPNDLNAILETFSGRCDGG